MSNGLLRPALAKDLPAISAIYNDAVLKTTATYDYEPEPLSRREAWFEEHRQMGLPIFVTTTASGTVTGWSSLSPFHRRPGFRFTVENSIYVAEEYRGQGLGSALMEPLISAGIQLGLHSIIAAVDASNQISVRLHQRFGFQEIGRFPEVGYKFDRWLDVLYLQRRLSTMG